MTGPLPEHVRVAVIGAGLSGLGAGIARRMASSVWTTGGCTSWYLAADGRNPTLWPGSVRGFRQATRRVSLDEYQLIHGVTSVPGATLEDLLTAAQRMPAGHGAMFRWTRPVSALPPPG